MTELGNKGPDILTDSLEELRTTGRTERVLKGDQAVSVIRPIIDTVLASSESGLKVPSIDLKMIPGQCDVTAQVLYKGQSANIGLVIGNDKDGRIFAASDLEARDKGILAGLKKAVLPLLMKLKGKDKKTGREFVIGQEVGRILSNLHQEAEKGIIEEIKNAGIEIKGIRIFFGDDSANIKIEAKSKPQAVPQTEPKTETPARTAKIAIIPPQKPRREQIAKPPKVVKGKATPDVLYTKEEVTTPPQIEKKASETAKTQKTTPKEISEGFKVITTLLQIMIDREKEGMSSEDLDGLLSLHLDTQMALMSSYKEIVLLKQYPSLTDRQKEALRQMDTNLELIRKKFSEMPSSADILDRHELVYEYSNKLSGTLLRIMKGEIK